ncbi:MAG TPA: LssY C-terminal domain-containing protein [Candidatus Binatia bacterium]|nr:LssY C-terminal domain-containing protein [Candidatus Binatia bacterium]
MKSAFSLLVVLLAIAPLQYSPRAYAAASRTSSKSATVSGSQWVDTGMDVQAGDKLHITAKGTVNMGKDTGITADGAQRGWVDTLRALAVPSAGRGALVGRIGTSDAATPFFIGADGTVQAPIAGRLYLAINTDSMLTPDGKYEVHIDRTASSTATASGAAASQGKYDFAPLFAELNAKLPYRVTDQPQGGNPGDLVNFVLVGTQQQVTDAFKAAGWIAADKTDKEAVVSALMATLEKNVYVAVPMSILYLFGRSQDFGYERAEAVMVAAQRNHFRIWQAPFKTPQNQPIWAGAGTHDIGIERDQRSANAITHKIDQDVDNERDFIGATLQQAGQVEAMSYMTRSNPIKSTKTATGGNIQSDGRVLVIVLKGAQTAKAK